MPISTDKLANAKYRRTKPLGGRSNTDLAKAVTTTLILLQHADGYISLKSPEAARYDKQHMLS